MKIVEVGGVAVVPELIAAIQPFVEDDEVSDDITVRTYSICVLPVMASEWVTVAEWVCLASDANITEQMQAEADRDAAYHQLIAAIEGIGVEARRLLSWPGQHDT